MLTNKYSRNSLNTQSLVRAVLEGGGGRRSDLFCFLVMRTAFLLSNLSEVSCCLGRSLVKFMCSFLKITIVFSVESHLLENQCRQ